MYGKASFLLVWNGSGGGFFWQSNDGSDPWNPAWTIDIGTPPGSSLPGRGRLAALVLRWNRPSQPPLLVLLRPSSLGANYLTPSGSTVSSVTLPPVTGMVLRSTSTQPAPSVARPPETRACPRSRVPPGWGRASAPAVGSWSNSPASYGYQWHRCNSTGDACASVAGASSSSYLLDSGADVGYTIRVNVSATNPTGTGSAELKSDRRRPGRRGILPRIRACPWLSGSAQVGQSLTATAGGWSGSPTSYAHQWRRCDTIGNGCVSIAGANSNSYLLASGDGGYTLRIAVSATNADGTVSGDLAPDCGRHGTGQLEPEPEPPGQHEPARDLGVRQLEGRG